MLLASILFFFFHSYLPLVSFLQRRNTCPLRNHARFRRGGQRYKADDLHQDGLEDGYGDIFRSCLSLFVCHDTSKWVSFLAKVMLCRFSFVCSFAQRAYVGISPEKVGFLKISYTKRKKKKRRTGRKVIRQRLSNTELWLDLACNLTSNQGRLSVDSYEVMWRAIESRAATRTKDFNLLMWNRCTA